MAETAARGLRVISLARRDLPAADPARPPDFFDEPPAERLTLLAIVGIKDPVRPEARAQHMC
jgi:magnesium-transporting ATPase (P-type)